MLPKFPPTTDDEVDVLMDTTIPVSAYILLSLLSLLSLLILLSTCILILLRLPILVISRRLRSEMKTYKEVRLIGAGFQHVIDS